MSFKFSVALRGRLGASLLNRKAMSFTSRSVKMSADVNEPVFISVSESKIKIIQSLFALKM